jgi:hypothetical protein
LLSKKSFIQPDFLNWMPPTESSETQDAGDAEKIQESTEFDFATAFQGI